jgi:hypothetical protein
MRNSVPVALLVSVSVKGVISTLRLKDHLEYTFVERI